MNEPMIERMSSVPIRSPGPDLQVHAEQLLVKRAGLPSRLVRHPRHGGVESHARLDADHQQIEHVGQRIGDGPLPLSSPESEPHIGDKPPEATEDDGHRQHIGKRALRHDAIEDVRARQRPGQRSLAAQEQRDGRGLLKTGQDETPAIAAEETRVAWREPLPQACHQRLPPRGRTLLPPEDRRARHRCAGERAREAFAPDGGQETEQQRADRKGRSGDQQEHDADDERGHGFTP
jgi:hypothetical protein